jgi:hypothetical protein
MTPWLEALPLWLSLGAALAGVVVSIRLAWLAYGGVLFSFTIILTVGIVIFSFHHLLELADPELRPLAEVLQAASSAVFLMAAGFMGYRLRKILDKD